MNPSLSTRIVMHVVIHAHDDDGDDDGDGDAWIVLSAIKKPSSRIRWHTHLDEADVLRAHRARPADGVRAFFQTGDRTDVQNVQCEASDNGAQVDHADVLNVQCAI